jgi:hypothetical protein
MPPQRVSSLTKRCSDLAPFKPASTCLYRSHGGHLSHSGSLGATILHLSPINKVLGDAGEGGCAMSKAKWNPSPAREAAKLIKLAESKGYEVTSIETINGNARIGVRKPGRADTIVSEAEQLRQNL